MTFKLGSKISIIVVIVNMFCFNASAQNTKVSASISGLKDTEVEIMHTVGQNWVKDTVDVDNGDFVWQTDLTEPTLAIIRFSNTRFNFYLENGKIQIKGSADSLSTLKVTGSKMNDDANQYISLMKDVRTRTIDLRNKRREASEEEAKVLDSKLKTINEERAIKQDEFINSHLNSSFTIALLRTIASRTDHKTMLEYYGKLSSAVKNTSWGLELQKEIEAVQKTVIGTTILDFTINDVNGNSVSISDFKGKYVLIDFWASWCGPCRRENPNLLKAYNKYKDKGFTVVGVSLDEKEASWKKAIAKDQMPWTQLSDLKGFKGEVAEYYNISGIPYILLIDKEGKIIDKNLRGEALHKKLSELLD